MYHKISKILALVIAVFSIYYFELSVITALVCIYFIVIVLIKKMNRNVKVMLNLLSLGVNILSLVLIFYMINNIPEKFNEKLVYKSSHFRKNSYNDILKELTKVDKFKSDEITKKLNEKNYDKQIQDNLIKSKALRESIIQLINETDFEYPLEKLLADNMIHPQDKSASKWGNLLTVYKYEIAEIDGLITENKTDIAKKNLIKLFQSSEKLSKSKTNPLGMAIMCAIVNLLSDCYIENRENFNIDDEIIAFIDTLSLNIPKCFSKSVIVESYTFKNMIRDLGNNKEDFLMTSTDPETNKIDTSYFPVKWPFLDKNRTRSKIDEFYFEYLILARKEYYISDKSMPQLIEKYRWAGGNDFLNNVYGNLIIAAVAPNFKGFHYSKERTLSKLLAVKYILTNAKEIPIDRLTGEKFIVENHSIKSKYIRDGKNVIDIKY